MMEAILRIVSRLMAKRRTEQFVECAGVAAVSHGWCRAEERGKNSRGRHLPVAVAMERGGNHPFYSCLALGRALTPAQARVVGDGL